MSKTHDNHANYYIASYARFNLPVVQQELQQNQSSMPFKKVSLLNDVNVSYSANSTCIAETSNVRKI